MAISLPILLMKVSLRCLYVSDDITPAIVFLEKIRIRNITRIITFLIISKYVFEA